MNEEPQKKLAQAKNPSILDWGVPKSLEDAVAILIKWMGEDAERFAAMDEQKAISSCHHVGGQLIRNEWGLWGDSVLARHFHKRFGLTHADDMSGLIFTCAHRELNDTSWAEETQVEYYKEFWSKNGGMPKPAWEQEAARQPPITDEPPPEPTPLQKAFEENRVARFDISDELVQREPDAVATVLAGKIIVRCEMVFHKRSFEYIAYSPDFPPHDRAMELDRYICFFSRTNDGQFSIELRKRPA